MKLNVNFQALHDSVRKMGAKEFGFKYQANLSEIDFIDVQLELGINVNIDEIEILENGLLSYKERQVLLYIQDHGWRVSDALKYGDEGKKYHVAYCQTLDSMHSKGRYDRYVVKHDISGFFYIDGSNRDTGEYEDGEAQLSVCKHCLKHLDYCRFKDVDFSVKKVIFHDFSIKQFFTEYSQYFKFKPKYNAGKKKSAYTTDWLRISQNYRENKKWICELCHTNLAVNRGLLHTHHKNGIKSDNSKSNLMALCVDCHSKQADHHHMKPPVKHLQKLKLIRDEQGV